MKYLKKFNESLDNLYEFIELKDFMNYVGGNSFKRLVEFSDNDIKTIKKFKGKYSFSIDTHYMNTSSLNKISMWGSKSDINLNWFESGSPSLNYLNTVFRNGIGIIKNDDDFYLVSIGLSHIILCDTIDGVVSLFKDVIKQG